MKLYLAVFLVASDLLISHGEMIMEWNRSALNSNQTDNIVNVLILTPDEDQKTDGDYIANLTKVVGAGIEKVAKDLITVEGGQGDSTTSSTNEISSTGNPVTETPSIEASKAKPEEEPADPKPSPEVKRSKRESEKKDEKLPPLTTTLVIDLDQGKGLLGFDFSKPLEFFVSTEYEIINGGELTKSADNIVTAIEEKAKESDPKNPLKFTIAVVNQGMAAWAIVLIVIAVLLVVGAAGYFLISYFRKRRGNSF